MRKIEKIHVYKGKGFERHIAQIDLSTLKEIARFYEGFSILDKVYFLSFFLTIIFICLVFTLIIQIYLLLYPISYQLILKDFLFYFSIFIFFVYKSSRKNKALYLRQIILFEEGLYLHEYNFIEWRKIKKIVITDEMEDTENIKIELFDGSIYSFNGKGIHGKYRYLKKYIFLILLNLYHIYRQTL